MWMLAQVAGHKCGDGDENWGNRGQFFQSGEAHTVETGSAVVATNHAMICHECAVANCGFTTDRARGGTDSPEQETTPLAAKCEMPAQLENQQEGGRWLKASVVAGNAW